MKKLILNFAVLGVLFSFAATTVFAQGPKLWIVSPGKMTPEYITDGKTKITMSFFGVFNVEQLVKDNPTALALAEKQSSAVTHAHLAYWLGVIPSAGVLGAGLALKDTTTIVISGIALLGTGILAGHFVGQARHYMFEAINTYNGVPGSDVSTSSAGSDASTQLAAASQPFQLGWTINF